MFEAESSSNSSLLPVLCFLSTYSSTLLPCSFYFLQDHFVLCNSVIGCAESSGCNPCRPGYGGDIHPDSVLKAGSGAEAVALSLVHC